MEQRASYGKSELGQGAPVNVEYVSANPTGPLHVGHCRGAVFGDALANLLEFAGHAVTREYYINDAGAQVDVLARSAYLRYREALGEEIGDIPEGFYPGDYLMPVGQRLAEEFGDRLLAQEEGEWLPVVREVATDAMMEAIRSDLDALNIRFDVFFSERSLSGDDGGEVAATVAELRGRDLVYEGRLPPPKGQLPDDWEDSELAPLFDLQPAWTFFFDAGQAWEAGEILSGLARTDSPTRLDVGLGIFVGPFGMYWAIPLNERDRDFNFFVRLQRRF